LRIRWTNGSHASVHSPSDTKMRLVAMQAYIYIITLYINRNVYFSSEINVLLLTCPLVSQLVSKMACSVLNGSLIWINAWAFYKSDFTIQNPIASSFHCKIIELKKTNFLKVISTLKLPRVFFTPCIIQFNIMNPDYEHHVSFSPHWFIQYACNTLIGLRPMHLGFSEQQKRNK
jgi:hypothetical protein